MKAIISLMILAGLIGGGVYYFGGYRDFDPNKQGKAARAAIKPGMTLKQVMDIGGNNPKIQPINTFKHKVGQETVEEERPGLSVPFDHGRTTQQMKGGFLPKGFILNYKYSEQTAFDVYFNGNGVVTAVTDAFTLGTLFNQ